MCPLQELFAAYDKDKSGTISFEELTEGLRGQGYVVNESEVGWLGVRVRVSRGWLGFSQQRGICVRVALS
jgi:Ca2+-binding EF-hand superfamily protein